MSAVADAPIATVPDALVAAPSVARTRLIEVAAVVMVFGVGLSVFINRVTRPFPWTDEAATTLVVSRRTWQQIAVLWQGIDAPHVPYYLLAKAWLGPWSWLGLSPLVTVRLMSVLAMAAAVACVCLFARREAGMLAGLLAAAFMIALPGVSRQAQDARPYALLTLAVAASWLAWSWWRTTQTGRRRSAGIVWAATLVFAAAMSPFGLLVVLAQVAAHWGLTRGQARERRAAMEVLLPVVLLAVPQLAVTIIFGRGTDQAVEINANSVSRTFAAVLANTAEYASLVPLLVLAVLALALIVGRWRRGEALRRLAVIAAVWLGVSLAAGIGAALVRPQLLLARYWTPMAAPVAVLAGVGLAAVVTMLGTVVTPTRPRTATILAAVCALAAVGVQVWLVLPAQRSLRSSGGHLSVGNAIAVATQFHQAHPQAPILITASSRQAVFLVARPGLAALNPLYVVDDNSVSVWPVLRPDADIVAAVADQPNVLWLSPPHTDAQVANLPAGLVAQGVTVLNHRGLRSWEVTTLTIG
jgi:mannosyltransferase